MTGKPYSRLRVLTYSASRVEEEHQRTCPNCDKIFHKLGYGRHFAACQRQPKLFKFNEEGRDDERTSGCKKVPVKGT